MAAQWERGASRPVWHGCFLSRNRVSLFHGRSDWHIGVGRLAALSRQGICWFLQSLWRFLAGLHGDGRRGYGTVHVDGAWKGSARCVGEWEPVSGHRAGDVACGNRDFLCGHSGVPPDLRQKFQQGPDSGENDHSDRRRRHPGDRTAGYGLRTDYARHRRWGHSDTPAGIWG